MKGTAEILKASTEELYSSLLPLAFKKRTSLFGLKVETCAILNAKSGKCPSDCAFCAQSSKFNLSIPVYPLLPEEELVRKALEAFKTGIDRFSFVTSGISPSKKEVLKLGRVIETIKAENPSARICASLGQLDINDLKYLKECGLDRYHHNLETSREFYPRISKVQSWEDRVNTVKRAKEAGLSVCCGGIFGMGESDDDIASLSETLKELDVDSVPVNFLKPIKGTALENANFLTPLKCLKILIFLRLSLPKAQIRVCGGREYNLKQLQPLSLLVIDSLMVGNYLTTKGRNIKDDKEMIEEMGFYSNLEV